MIDGIEHQVDNNSNIFLIQHFSDDLKNNIRVQLSSICHGISDGESIRISYNYQNTLKEFFTRYDQKKELQKVGMMGELLSHILLLEYFENFDTVSPYFNLEERGVKKGFDLVLYNTEDSQIWITEVKSGHLHKDKNANGTSNDLLGTAQRDLNTRLNENNQALWMNAINGIIKSLENYSDKKKLVKDILEDVQDEVVQGNASSLDKNVILISNLFHSLFNDSIHIDTAKTFSNKLVEKKFFKNLIIVCIQKETMNKIEAFLRSEITV